MGLNHNKFQEEGDTESVKDDTEEILNSILPPREWEHDGNIRQVWEHDNHI